MIYFKLYYKFAEIVSFFMRWAHYITYYIITVRLHILLFYIKIDKTSL